MEGMLIADKRAASSMAERSKEPKPEAAQSGKGRRLQCEGRSADATRSLERTRNGRHGLDHAGNECRLHLGHSVVDRNAHALIENLKDRDLGRAHRAVLVGTG